MLNLSTQNQPSKQIESSHHFKHTIVVIKYGGSIMLSEAAKTSFFKEIALLVKSGVLPIIVHGGGKEINNKLNKLNIKSSFLDGYRITCSDAMSEIEMVLSGKVNSEIVMTLNQVHVKAIGLSGKSMNLFESKKKTDDPLKDYGYVGHVIKVNPGILHLLITNGIVPVISPISFDKNGQTYNVNADDVASSIAIALNVDKLVLLTDVDGISTNPDDVNTKIDYITAKDLQELINNKTLNGSILPKILCCISAIENGVKTCHVINGLKDNTLSTLFSQHSHGTTITQEVINESSAS